MSSARSTAELLDEMRRLHPLLIDLSLERIEGLLERIGRPHESLPPVVHVAGTNGKGSTIALLGAMARAAGLRVHTYTSPHLVRYHERIGIADTNAPGQTLPICDALLADVLQRVLHANGGDPITFFEITTAAAFVAFSEQPADVLFLEVGLGGRLDTTNVVSRPQLCVITPVAMDHADKLGNTIGKIAAEKAGILKPGVPCVVAPQEAQAQEAITRAAEAVDAPLILWGRDFDAYVQNGRLLYQAVHADPEPHDALQTQGSPGNALLDLPLPALRGPHQVINAGTAIAAARALAVSGRSGFERIDEKAIAVGLQTATWPGRMTQIQDGPLRQLTGPDDELWLDGGHNPAAARAIAQTLADLEDRAPKPTTLVCGMMAQKDADGFLEAFRGLVARVIAVPVQGGVGPAVDHAALAGRAQDLGFDAISQPSLQAALRHLAGCADAPQRILICGSLYLAGQAVAAQSGMQAEPN